MGLFPLAFGFVQLLMDLAIASLSLMFVLGFFSLVTSILGTIAFFYNCILSSS
ncbi:hypothetical protein AXF42_Ash009810 [Apostasia shenzhenica]|uniref:Uncharacterized protein n=1 Tax=Apostasia shenzhenica TaxID=1088818 RepID=A0A2I0AX77_9ASPA|nr:hypothetical protein AXF42_Ash009810 [Apostasia shenzhenica]